MPILKIPRISTQNGNDPYHKVRPIRSGAPKIFLESQLRRISAIVIAILCPYTWQIVKHAHQFDTGFAPIGQSIIIAVNISNSSKHALMNKILS